MIRRLKLIRYIWANKSSIIYTKEIKTCQEFSDLILIIEIETFLGETFKCPQQQMYQNHLLRATNE